MPWRDFVIQHLGPGLLGGIALGDWLKLLRDNRFAIAPSALPRAMSITVHAIQNSIWGRIENRRFAEQLETVSVEPPLFLLGHWRSGTTHLHYLVALDERFAYPNNYQALYPHAFLTTESFSSRMIQAFLPRRRPMDNVEWTMQSPQEDEFGILGLTTISPCIGWHFPRRHEFYDRYLTLREASESEIARWKSALMLFLRKLTLKYQRPLVLKSPPHTCRIRLLLELFPDAKFVHIHRDPYAVFQSTRHLFESNRGMHHMQRFVWEDRDDWILDQYCAMYESFFEERLLIPSGNYCEIAYEQLEVDPIGQMQSIYQKLNLPSFERVEPTLRKYLDSVATYKKNEFQPLPDPLRQKLAERCRTCFEEWGYLP